MNWANKYIGIPYEKGGQTLDAFDCWGLFHFIQKEHFNLDLPFIDVDAGNILQVAKELKNNEEKQNWQQIKMPKNGCAVLMAHARYPSHVGIWLDIDAGGVLHCVKGIGVIFSTLTALKLAGWGRIEFYEHHTR